MTITLQNQGTPSPHGTSTPRVSFNAIPLSLDTLNPFAKNLPAKNPLAKLTPTPLRLKSPIPFSPFVSPPTSPPEIPKLSLGWTLNPSTPPPKIPRVPRVGIIGAGRVGSTLAQRLVEKQIAHGVLLDIVPGLPQGIALDLMEARGIERHDCTLMGTNDYDDLQDMDLMVITAGKPRKPGMNRADLLEINGKIVAEAAKQAISRSPNAILLVVTNPLDAMTYTAWKASELPPHRVLGMAGVLDSARLQTFIALELGVSILDVTTMVLGSHGDAMVPLPRYCTVNGIPITELLATEAIQRIVARTQQGGAEIVKLMQTGSAFYAPAAAACLMVEAILTDRSRVVPATCYLQGEYGLRDLYLGVPARLGRRGIEEILELKLQPSELATLGRSATTIQNQIAALQPLLSSL